jgi:dTDP-4-dehydrorhamnose reductase
VSAEPPRGWLVTGAGGQVGGEVVRALSGEPVVGLDRAALDITDEAAVRDAVAEARPQVVVNLAAYTAVDAAESDEEAALRVNGVAPGHLAAAARACGARLVHVSTDYVFAGDGDRPYAEDSVPDPRTAYGRTKRAGELAVLAAHPGAWVVRTAWVYGGRGPHFLRAMAQRAAGQGTVAVVDDQRGAPTWARPLAEALVALGRSSAPPGVYHCTSAGDTTWFGFARAIFAALAADPERVTPTTAAALGRPAARPAYSVLSNQKWVDAGLPPMPHWRDGLAGAVAAGAAERGPDA